jgi:hypothetical protein
MLAPQAVEHEEQDCQMADDKSHPRALAMSEVMQHEQNVLVAPVLVFLHRTLGSALESGE